MVKLVNLSPRPDAGKASKMRLIFSADLATRLLLREYDSNIRAIIGPLDSITASMDQFSVDTRITELLSKACHDPRAVFMCVDATDLLRGFILGFIF